MDLELIGLLLLLLLLLYTQPTDMDLEAAALQGPDGFGALVDHYYSFRPFQAEYIKVSMNAVPECKVRSKSVRLGPLSVGCSPKSARCGPESVRCGPESVRCGAESVRCGPESVRCSPNSIKQGP